MDHLIAFFTRKNIVALLILAVLAAGLLVGLRLVQQQTQLKSKAAQDCHGGEADGVTQQQAACLINKRADIKNAYTSAGWCDELITYPAMINDWLNLKNKSANDVADITSCGLTVRAGTVAATGGGGGQTGNVGVGTPVTVGGRVTSTASGNPGISGITIQIYDDTFDQQTRSINTDGSGSYSLSGFVRTGDSYRVIPPLSPPQGYTGIANPPDYNQQNAGGSPDCATRCNFTFTPVPSQLDYNSEWVSPISIQSDDGVSGTLDNFPGGLVTGKSYQFTITMRNVKLGNAQTWTTAYKLLAIPPTSSDSGLGLSRTAVPVEFAVPPDPPNNTYNFVITIRPTVSGNHRFIWQMVNDKGDRFGALIDVTLSIASAGGGPGPSPSPGTFDVEVDSIDDMEITQGSSDIRKIKVTRKDETSGSLVINLSASGFPSRVDHSFSETSCDLRRAGSSCTRDLKIEPKDNARPVEDKEITVAVRKDVSSGQLLREAKFNLTIRSATTTSPSPSASPTTAPSSAPFVKTECFFMDDKPVTANSCSDEGAQAYTTDPMVVPLILTTPGRKTVFVRFISTDGQIRSFQRVINFAPDPRLTEVSCSHSLSGTGSVVSITGIALGPGDKGKVKLAGDDANIITWNETDGTITASIDKRIEGKNQVEITRSDGKSVRGECIVGTTSVTFTAQNQCRSAGNFTAENVSVKIFANAPTTIETEKPEPIINEKIKVGKDGKPSGFVPKLEKDKKYSLIVKAPGTLSKRIDFETKGGTRNLDAVTLSTGDIAPVTSADGKINAFDRSELIRQWSLVRDVTRSGDFNQDGRINSIDYACMRQNINQSDEEFSPPTLTSSPPPVGVGTTEPVGVGTTSPPPAGGPSGILPFRVSFDPDFATIALDGDMGIETSLTLDLILTGGPGLKSVYVQFFEDGAWGPVPPQTASILLK